MKMMQKEDIIKFLKDNIEPLNNNIYGQGYRASVYLTDGTFLPCVIFRNSEKIVELAIKRFKQEQEGKSIFSKSSGLGYSDIVKTFVAKGNCINDYNIARIEKSHSALPLSILEQIQGETTMGWTGFVAKMKDGKCFGFGTTFLFEFFQMPKGYLPENIEEIINHSYISKLGDVCDHKTPFIEYPINYDDDIIYRERPYFECFIDDL